MVRKIYAGIGSRHTPGDVLITMLHLAQDLSDMGWVLRSGHADGADQAFEQGAKPELREIYLPWASYNKGGSAPGHRFAHGNRFQMDIAAKHHPAWHNCSQGAKKLHTRNVSIVLGEDLITPADFVVCWTHGGTGSGGTGMAIRIAGSYDIPVFDLAIPGDLEALIKFVNSIEQGADAPGERRTA